jgi:hypothetical protein
MANHPADSRQGVATDSEIVELSIPAHPELLSLPRLTAAALAARAGFDIEEIEDIRLAVEELCLAAFEGRGSGRLRLRLGFRAGSLEVDCTFEREDPEGGSIKARNGLASELTEQLLSALTDEHGTDVEAGDPRAWFRKRRLDAPAE